MRKFLVFCLLSISYFQSKGQCKYVWANWQQTATTDTAIASLTVNGFNIAMTMSANYLFDFTPQIFNYSAFAAYPDVPPNTTIPRTTWSFGAGGTTTMCFSQPVVNPVLLLASIGSVAYPVSLNFSLPFNVLYDAGGNTFLGTMGIYGAEGNCIIEFPGTFTCITIYSTTLEFYTNLTWGIKNPLKASFTYSNSCTSLTASFNSDSSYVNAPGAIIGYHWDFGDGDTSSVQNPTHTYATADTFDVTLVITSDNFCRDTIVHQVIFSGYSTSNNPQTICNGGSYSIGNNVYSTSGTYYDTIPATVGCDSVVITQLVVSNSTTNNNPVTICNGQSVTINSHVYDSAGTYHDTLTSVSGCDSIVITQLTVNPSYNQSNMQTICNGNSYTINGHVYTTPGIYYDTLSTLTGCDSIVTTQLSFGLPQTVSNAQSICNGQSYNIGSSTYSLSGTYYDTLSSTTGCDSVVITNLQIQAAPSITFLHPADLCVDAAPIALNHASPSGGIYSGPGVVGNTFDPSMALAGIHQINYSYIDPVTNCTGTKAEVITVHSLPEVNLEITPKHINILTPNMNYRDLTTGGKSWWWDFGDGTTSQIQGGIHQYNDTGTYTITLFVTDSLGCVNFSQEFAVVDYEFSFYVPNSFTPDDDGINDLFSGLGVGIDFYKMQIYNRWGDMIFETENLHDRWNGNSVACDTYVYKINLKDNLGNDHEYVGKVSVVR